MGKRGYADSTGQTEINALLVKHAGESGLVVRLKGGDPSIFGRLEEELEALAEAGIDCEVVPGVTAAIAAAAATQRPLTRRGQGRSVSFTTAMTRTGALQAKSSPMRCSPSSPAWWPAGPPQLGSWAPLAYTEPARPLLASGRPCSRVRVPGT